ncbi:GFA family protein [Sphingomonas sp.]|uniref:GFA family protein n=1 Tax=Sphingomonas sp. TaxID=28214 RepID=UPI0025DC66B0|nr:GFA family protein [Sphingomonas sp.]
MRYLLAGGELPRVYCCHCRACQSWSSSAFTEQAPVRESELTVSGALATFTYQTPSGATSTHSACAKCFSRVFNVNERLPGYALLRAGTLDDSHAIVPVAHIWTSAKQPWVVLPEGVPAFDEGAPQDEFRKLTGLE